MTYIRGPPEPETGVQYALMDFLSRENSKVNCCVTVGKGWGGWRGGRGGECGRSGRDGKSGCIHNYYGHTHAYISSLQNMLASGAEECFRG